MTARGRPPKPTAVKALQGNPGKRPLNTSEPQPQRAGRTPSPPKELGIWGKKEWRRIASELFRLGLLTKIDETALTAYCQQLDLYMDAKARVDEYGTVVMAGNGTPMPNPGVGVMRGALREMQNIGAKFGLTPSDRARMNVDPAEPVDPIANSLFNVPKPTRSA